MKRVYRASKDVRKVHTDANDRCLERYAEELEKGVRKHNVTNSDGSRTPRKSTRSTSETRRGIYCTTLS